MLILKILYYGIEVFKWASFVLSALGIVLLLLDWLFRKKISLVRIILLVLLAAYCSLFFFTPGFLSVLWYMFVAVSCAFSDYEDKRKGNKWWQWR